MKPVFGFLQGDTIGLLILAETDMTMADITARLQRMAQARVPIAAGYHVFFHGKQLADELTLAESGIQPLDRIDVRATL